MARPARFERAAFRLGGERSILLSYGRILWILILWAAEAAAHRGRCWIWEPALFFC